MTTSAESSAPGGPPSKRKIYRVESLVAAGVVLLVWFASVLGAAWDVFWLGPALVLILSTLHCAYSATWREDLKLMVGLGVVGTVLDSAQAVSGFLVFYGRPESWPAWLAPPWTTAIWFHFGTLRWPLFRPLAGRLRLAALCGAVVAPVAYWGGVRLGAAAFGEPVWAALLSLALVLAVLMPTATRWTWRRDQ